MCISVRESFVILAENIPELRAITFPTILPSAEATSVGLFVTNFWVPPGELIQDGINKVFLFLPLHFQLIPFLFSDSIFSDAKYLLILCQARLNLIRCLTIFSMSYPSCNQRGNNYIISIAGQIRRQNNDEDEGRKNNDDHWLLSTEVAWSRILRPRQRKFLENY